MQLNATEPFDINGAVGQLAHFAKGIVSGRPGHTLPAAAGGAGEVAEEAAPLLLA